MSDDNLSILTKADLKISDLKGEAGYMPAGQSARFIRIAIDESVVMSRVRVRPMSAPAELVEKIKFGDRIMRAGSEATPVAQADRARPNMSKVELLAKLFRAEVDLSDEVLEDSIERGALRNTVLTLMAERSALDMDEALVNSDTTSDDPFLAQFNGILKQSSSHVVAAGGETLNRGIFLDCVKKLPTRYRKNKRDLVFFTGMNAELDYLDTFADRATPIGDDVIAGRKTSSNYGTIPVVGVPVFAEDLGNGNNETSMLLTNPNNILVGLWRRIRMRTDLLVREGLLVICADTRFDVKYEEETAVVKATGIEIAA